MKVEGRFFLVAALASMYPAQGGQALLRLGLLFCSSKKVTKKDTELMKCPEPVRIRIHSRPCSLRFYGRALRDVYTHLVLLSVRFICSDSDTNHEPEHMADDRTGYGEWKRCGAHVQCDFADLNMSGHEPIAVRDGRHPLGVFFAYFFLRKKSMAKRSSDTLGAAGGK